MTGDDGIPDVPLSTHDEMLGVDIEVSQLADEEFGRTGRCSGAWTRENVVRVRPAYVTGLTYQKDRRYLAAWARRVLFKTANNRNEDHP